MKLFPTVTSSSINVKPIIFCIFCLFFLFFLLISMISLNPNGLRLRPSARKFLGLKMKRKLPEVCSNFNRRETINWNYFYYYKNPASQQELVWCKVPKAGSTTLTKLFLRLAGSKLYRNNTRVHKLLRDFYPRLPNQLMQDKLKISKTFMVARDPFERILSAYRDKLENYERDLIYRDGFYYEHYGKLMVKLDKVGRYTNGTSKNGTSSLNSTRKEPTWQEFVQYLLKTSVSKFNEHWMPMTKLCSPCTVQYDYIIKMENFDDDIQAPLKSAGITAVDLGVNHRTGSASTKLIEKYFKNLTMTEVKKLYTKYRCDFLVFNYSPYKYFKLAIRKGNSEKKKTNNPIKEIKSP